MPFTHGPSLACRDPEALASRKRFRQLVDPEQVALITLAMPAVAGLLKRLRVSSAGATRCSDDMSLLLRAVAGPRGGEINAEAGSDRVHGHEQAN
jgi:hypothetical protein